MSPRHVNYQMANSVGRAAHRPGLGRFQRDPFLPALAVQPVRHPSPCFRVDVREGAARAEADGVQARGVADGCEQRGEQRGLVVAVALLDLERALRLLKCFNTTNIFHVPDAIADEFMELADLGEPVALSELLDELERHQANGQALASFPRLAGHDLEGRADAFTPRRQVPQDRLDRRQTRT